MSRTFAIRLASESEASSVFTLIKEFQAVRRLVDPSAISASRILAAMRGSPPSTHLYLAFDEQQTIAGFALWYEGFSVYRGGSVYHIDAVFVRAPYKEQGLSHQLLTFIATQAAERNIAGIAWLSAKNDPEEQQFVEQLGVRPYDNLRFVFVKLSEIQRALAKR